MDTLTYFDGETVGRVQFNSGRGPTGALAEVETELAQAGRAATRHEESE